MGKNILWPAFAVALTRKLPRSLMCLAYFFYMLSMGVCTTRHWQTYVQLVQELNVGASMDGLKAQPNNPLILYVEISSK